MEKQHPYMSPLYVFVQLYFSSLLRSLRHKLWWKYILFQFHYYVHYIVITFRSSHPEVFLVKGALKISSKFTGEHPCRSVVLKKLQSNFIEIPLPHGCCPVNLLHIFRTPFTTNTSVWLLLNIFFFVLSYHYYFHYAVIKSQNIIFLVNNKINFATNFTTPGSWKIT